MIEWFPNTYNKTQGTQLVDVIKKYYSIKRCDQNGNITKNCNAIIWNDGKMAKFYQKITFILYTHQSFNGIWAQKACRIAFLRHLKTATIVFRDKIQMAIQQIIAIAPVAKMVT